MESQEKRFAVYLRIGQNELAVSGDDQDFVKSMLAEFKGPFLQAVAGERSGPAKPVSRGHKTKEPVVVSGDSLRDVAEPITSAPSETGETKPEPGFSALVDKVKPKTSVDSVLLLLYHIKNHEDTRPMKPKEMIRLLKGVGLEPVKAFSSNLEYLKRRGFVKKDPNGKGWLITGQGVSRVLELIEKA